MGLREHSREFDSVELLQLMEERDQLDQSFEMFNSIEESIEDARQDAADDVPLNQAAKEPWEDLGDARALDDKPTQVTEELSTEI